MSHFLDIERWPRRAQFEFFRTYELPQFGLTAEVDVTALRRRCRASDAPFSLACWFAVAEAANGVEALRLRLRGERVWVHDRIRIGTTVDTGPETFDFVYLPDTTDFPGFLRKARAAIARTRERQAHAPMDDRPDDDGVLHGTIIPWVRFTHLDHARRLGKDDSVPRVALGRAVNDGAPGEGPIRMPVSISAHHALVDGVHIGRFFERLQTLLDTPDWLDGPEANR